MKSKIQATETHTSNAKPQAFKPQSADLNLIDARLNELRSRISEVGQEIDKYRAKIAAGYGGGVFLLLLALGAAYEIFAGKAGVWRALGITPAMFPLIAAGLAASGGAMVAWAAITSRRRDYDREAELDGLERELSDLRDRKQALLQLED